MREKAGRGIFSRFALRSALAVLLCSLLCAASGAAADKKKKDSSAARQSPAPLLVDTIIASVNGKPITLRQLQARMSSRRTLSLSSLGSDPEVRYLLDLLILERVIQDEAGARRLSVTEGEIDRYIEEIAARNSLSRSGFEDALKREGKSLQDFKNQVRIEILKSRLTGNLLQAGAGVTRQEIQDYISAHPELSRSGSKVKLSQIFISLQDRSFDQARDRIEQIKKRLESGEEFSDLARELSEGAEARDGGSLGVLAEEDLNPVMFDTVFSMKAGETSDIVTSAEGFHIFLLQERIGEADSSSAKLEDEVRQVLEKEKTSRRIQEFFTSEVFKKHSIDKKI